MSKVGRVITEMCSGGVEFKTLGEVGQFVRGNGLQKKDLRAEGVGAIHYGQIFTTYGTFTSATKSFVAPALAASLRCAKPGDLVIATTSENDDDVCKAVAWLGANEIAVSGDAFIYSHELHPLYVAYFFQTEAFQSQKRRFISGTKVKRVSGTDLARIRIPVPPLAVQREIAAILAEMESLKVELEAELETELKYRSHQYTFYRDQLLTFGEAKDVRWIAMGELGTIFGGLTGKSKGDFTNGNARFVSYVHVFNNLTVNVAPDDFVRIGPSERQRSLRRGDILFTGSSESAADVAMSSVVTTVPEGPLYLNSFCIGFRPNQPDDLDPDYSKHLFRSGPVRADLVRTASGVTRFNVSKARLAKVVIPIPAKEDQRRIASVLDKLDMVVRDLSMGLPAEIAARRKQYEYYRDKLLPAEEAS